MTDKLLPCPFCGGEARLIEAECGTTIHAVECVLCQAKIGWFDEKERAIEAWNNRSNWHTGTPTEEGWYLVKCNKYSVSEYNTDYFRKEQRWAFGFQESYVAWQKITPYEGVEVNG